MQTLASPQEKEIPDDISLTSTIDTQHGSDDEFSVERILAESHVEGDPTDRWYLIQWTGYNADQWTWEPATEIGPPCLDEWAATKKRQEEGDEEPFDLEKWEEEKETVARHKLDRHRRRNLRRKREGLPLRLREGEQQSDYRDNSQSLSDDDFNAIFPPPRDFSHRVGAVSTETNHGHTGLEDIQLSSRSSGKASLSADKRRAGNLGNELARAGPGKISSTSSTTIDDTASRPRNIDGPKKGVPTPDKTKRSTVVSRPAIQSSVNSQMTQQAAPSRQPVLTKAKKSKSSAVAPVLSKSGNIFISGKKAQKRQKRVEVVAGQPGETKLYRNASTLRKAELKGRAKADLPPPDPRLVGLFNISTGVPAATEPKSASNERSTSAHRQNTATSDFRPKSALKRTQSDTIASSSPRRGGQDRARPNSVHFTGEDATGESPSLTSVHYFNDTPISEEPQASGDPIGTCEPRSTQPRRVSFQSYQKRHNQPVQKTIVLGPRDSTQVEVLFSNLPKKPEPWLSQFALVKLLLFSHVCTAQAFASEYDPKHHDQGLKIKAVGCGTITAAETESAALSGSADQLKLGGFGLVCFHDSFRILLYPSNCDAWKQVIPDANMHSPTDAPFKYTIFIGHPSTAKLLSPVPRRDYEAKDTDGSQFAKTMRLMLDIDYERLLPVQMREPSQRHNFFLAFPPAEGAAYATLCRWLRDVNPECRLFSSYTEGDWLSFTEELRNECGTVIIHGLAMQTIRLFPSLSKLLGGNKRYSFWSLSTSDEDVPGRDSRLLKFDRIFPHGNAVLLTPSFLLTQPRRACQLVQWHHSATHSGSTYNMLVASADIARFLQDLALEKANERKNFLQQQFGAKADLEDRARLHGISEEDCKARFQLQYLVNELLEKGQGIAIYESRKPITLVDSCINANDEQSLVNWFGWWALGNVHHFRKFHVLGSHEDDHLRATRFIPVPTYAPDTTKDPEIAMARTELHAWRSDGSPTSSTGGGYQIVPNDNAATLKDFLLQDDFQARCVPFLKLYNTPVSYFHNAMEMADRFQDFRMTFASFNSWFKYLWPIHNNGVVNTYLGFFYTIDGEWNLDKYPQGRFPPRSPWIAVYRPHQPNRKPYQSMELLIWDCAAPLTISGPEGPHRSDLKPAQQALIDLVTQEAPSKNPGLALRHVWYGGFDQSDLTTVSPLDRTLEMLEYMMLKPFEFLPAPKHLLPVRGYRSVDLLDIDPMDLDPPVDASEETSEQDANIIFHPPRGFGNRTVGGTGCNNLLFEEANKLCLAGKNNTLMKYQYPATSEWYLRQKKEGRHFEYLNVDVWKGIFDSVGIHQAGP